MKSKHIAIWYCAFKKCQIYESCERNQALTALFKSTNGSRYLQIRKFGGELENRQAEIRTLQLLLTGIQSGYQALQEQNAQNKEMIESLQNNVFFINTISVFDFLNDCGEKFTMNRTGMFNCQDECYAC